MPNRTPFSVDMTISSSMNPPQAMPQQMKQGLRFPSSSRAQRSNPVDFMSLKKPGLLRRLRSSQ
jgi:hypothetical protein